MDGQERDWLRPEVVAEPERTEPDRVAMYELRPLSLGEILDRTFALYRARFALFASISVVSASVQTVVQVLSLLMTKTAFRSLPTRPAAQGATTAALMLLQHRPAPALFPTHALLAAQGGAALAGLAYFLVAALTQAATTLALSQVYLGRPTSAREAFAGTVRGWYRWIAIALWQAWCASYPFLLALVPALVLLGMGQRNGSTGLIGLGAVLVMVAVLGAFPVGVVLYLRNALAVPAAVLEQLPVRPAMRRSKGLSAGAKGQIFVVLLIAGCLLLVVGMLESPLAFLILAAPHKEHYVLQVISLLITFLGRTVVAPVAMIGLTLVYFDQRVRKEALDLQLLLEGNRAAAVPAEAMPLG